MDLTQRLRGHQVVAVMTNGHILSIRTESGAEINVAWVDDNGVAIKGRPVVQSRGVRMKVEGFRDIVSHSQALEGAR